jgi:hypothetical protein
MGRYDTMPETGFQLTAEEPAETGIGFSGKDRIQ